MIRDIIEIARHELTASIKTARAILIGVLYVGSATLGGLVLVFILRKTEQLLMSPFLARGMSEEEAAAAISLEKVAMALAPGETERLADAFQSSTIAPSFFFGSLIFLPLLILVTSFDQVSADLQSRSICYSTLRTSRVRILFGKVLAQIAIFVGLTVLASFAWTLLAAAMVESFSVAGSILSIGYIVLLLLPYGLCCLSLSACCSSLVRQPFLALLLTFFVMIACFVFWLMGFISRDWAIGFLSYLEYLSPLAYVGPLWFRDLVPLFVSIGAFFGFSIVFLSLAAARLRSRDL